MTHRKLVAVLFGMLVIAGFSATSFAQKAEPEDFDSYKLRIDAGWRLPESFRRPHGLGSTTATGPIDLQKDLGFPHLLHIYWAKPTAKLTRKNHLY